MGLLAEPTRRELYDFVSGTRRAVSREEAADGVGVAVHTAKFHLDKLVEGGLLIVEFHKLTGRTGPGSGRPSKHYRRNEAEIAVTLPPRHYDLLSRVLADAVAQASPSEPLPAVVARAAREVGREVGEGREDGDLEEALRSCGYEPVIVNGKVVLYNCPFSRAAARHTQLVCGINRDFLEGLLEGLGIRGSQARLAPAPGRCCVAVEPS